MRSIIDVILLVCLGSSIGLTGLFYYTFCQAYFHPSNMVLIGVNRYGEAGFEVVLFAIILLGAIMGMLRLMLKIRKDTYIF